ALERIDGMFAVALWDRRDRTLHLVRDRLGEKPLYYSAIGRTVLFGSQLKALTLFPGFDKAVDRRALALLLRLSYVPSPLTIFAGARKLGAGSTVAFRHGQAGWPEPELWWDFSAVAGAARSARPAGQDAGALERLEVLMRESVARRLVADVPVGTFLSGGIDSSLVTALAQAGAGAGRVRTFTVGFGGGAGDETAHAMRVARHLGTEHTEIELMPADALAVVPDLHRWWDEPFADPSQLPTLLLCREARRRVTVALSGDGGDEVFGGYRRYTAGSWIARASGRVPVGVRRVGAGALRSVPVPAWDALERLGQRLLARRAVTDVGTKAYKLAGVMGAGSTREVYMGLVSAWDGAGSVVLDAGGWDGPPALPWDGGAAEEMMAWDTLSTLPDEMLVKVDRASMAFGLEVRVPLLDHRVVEAAWALPAGLRISGGTGKVALRRVLDRYVPRHLVERAKAGFDPPLGSWLRGPLRPWAEPLLSERRLRDQGLLDAGAVRARWAEHLAGRPGREYALWAVLVFQAWLDGQ
ncbi:MAG: asparagine synthase (glutamine-hydrolyzing), partial [Acidimicrobiales bacterium]